MHVTVRLRFLLGILFIISTAFGRIQINERRQSHTSRPSSKRSRQFSSPGEYTPVSGRGSNNLGWILRPKIGHHTQSDPLEAPTEFTVNCTKKTLNEHKKTEGEVWEEIATKNEERRLEAEREAAKSIQIERSNEIESQVHQSIFLSCNNVPSDIVFVLDGSYSVGPENFSKMLRFTASIVDTFPISRSETRVGVVQYSSSAITEIRLNQHFSKQELMTEIMSLKYRAEGTNTARALQHVAYNVFTHNNGARPPYVGVQRVLVLLSDGVWSLTEDIHSAINFAEISGIERFFIGVDSSISKEDISTFVSKPQEKHSFMVDGFDDLGDLSKDLGSRVCNNDVCDKKINGKVPGFNVLEHLRNEKIGKEAFTKGSSGANHAYPIRRTDDISLAPASSLFPKGLPHSFTIVATFHVREIFVTQPWVLFEARDEFSGVQESLRIIGGSTNSVEYWTVDSNGNSKFVKFDEVEDLFQPSFHKVTLRVGGSSISLEVDCVSYGKKTLQYPRHVTKSVGEIVVAKAVSNDETILVDVQQLVILCGTEHKNTSVTNCCELDDVEDDRCPPKPTKQPKEQSNYEQLELRRGDESEITNPDENRIVVDDLDRDISGALIVPPEPSQEPDITFTESREQGVDEVTKEWTETCQCNNTSNGQPDVIQGPEGPKGEKGEQGLRGKSGQKGMKGEPCKALVRNSAGVLELRGPPGKRGNDGPMGLPGPSGRPGRMGPKGHWGSRGPQGERGPRGMEGKKGPRGYQGLKGAIGKPGPEGPQGPKGAKGDEGIMGPMGRRGDEGPNGPKGHKGSPGPVGSPGMMGMKGHRGDDGDTGKQGQQGEVGKRGFPGPPGEKGKPGKSGKRGKVGERGEKGYRGPTGPIGSVGPIGAKGDVGERGEKGEQGLKGDQGEKGVKGPAILLSELSGFVNATLHDMIPRYMDELKRACQLCAVRPLLAGKPGPPGESGSTGKPGPIGFPGNEGPRGFVGQPGIAGPPGEKGDTGEKGDQGERGHTIPGPVGMPGKPGKRGKSGKSIRGRDGKKGPQGVQGRRGIPGTTGIQGPPGICDMSLCNPYAGANRRPPGSAMLDEDTKGPPSMPAERSPFSQLGARRRPTETVRNLNVPPTILRSLKGPNGSRQRHRLPGYDRDGIQ